jgi:hypothetical protein
VPASAGGALAAFRGALSLAPNGRASLFVCPGWVRFCPRLLGYRPAGTSHGTRGSSLKSLPSSSAAQFIWRPSPEPQGSPRSPRGRVATSFSSDARSQFIIGLWQCGDISEP